MSVTLSLLGGAGAQFFDNNGAPLAGGKLYTYAAGTTTPQPTYTTNIGDISHTNPIILNAAGRVSAGGEIWLLKNTNYKFILKTSSDITVFTADNIPAISQVTTLPASSITYSPTAPLASNNVQNALDEIFPVLAASNGAGLVGFIQNGTGAVATTVQTKLRTFISLEDFGAAENGTTNDRTAVDNAIAAATAANIPLVLAQKNALFFTSTTIPNKMSLGNLADMPQGRNIIANGNFHTWQRVDVRQLTPPVFNVAPPTFGNPATYSGTSGVPVTTADLWVGRLFGLYGTFTVSQSVLTPQEAIVSPGSQFKVNWATTAVTPPAATNVTITAITSPTSSPVTITAPSHGLSNGDYTFIKNNVYSGGNGTLDGTYQVSSVTTNTFNIAVTPDPSFSNFTAFGISTNDPFFETFAHVYDPSVPVWIRAGTGSFVFQYRSPDVQYNDGYYTVRVRIRRNSGSPTIRVRLFYDFGSGGSPTTTTSTVALLMQPSSSAIVDYIACVKIPSISAANYGTNLNTGYLAVSLDADPTSFNVDVFSVSVRPGVVSLPNDNWPQHDALPYLQQFYQGAYVGTVTPVTFGRFYGVTHSFNPAMRGTPDIAFVRNVSISNFNSPTVDVGLTNEGFLVSGEANATANVGRYVSIFEASYEIPT